MVIKATDLEAFGFYWMRTQFEDGSYDLKVIEYRFEAISECGDDRVIFSTSFDTLDNCEFIGPIVPPVELVRLLD